MVIEIRQTCIDEIRFILSFMKAINILKVIPLIKAANTSAILTNIRVYLIEAPNVSIEN